MREIARDAGAQEAAAYVLRDRRFCDFVCYVFRFCEFEYWYY